MSCTASCNLLTSHADGKAALALLSSFLPTCGDPSAQVRFFTPLLGEWRRREQDADVLQGKNLVLKSGLLLHIASTRWLLCIMVLPPLELQHSCPPEAALQPVLLRGPVAVHAPLAGAVRQGLGL